MEQILIVDDDVSSRFLLREMLAAAGYEVAECGDGVEVAAICAKRRPNLILMDLLMPKMGGIECCQELRRSYTLTQLPVIIVTSNDEQAELPSALQAGANDYVAKPINRTILLARVNNQLAIARAQNDTERLLDIQRITSNALPQALAIISGDAKVIHSNAMWDECCGGQKLRLMREAFDAIYGGVLGKTLNLLANESAIDPLKLIDKEVAFPSGPLRHVHIVSRPIISSRGEQLRLWLIRDITHMRELERSVNERIRLDSVGLLIKGVAHNFNNVLGGIVGAVEILSRCVPDQPRAQKAMDIIRRGSIAAAELTKKLSIFSDRDLPGAENSYEQIEEVLDALVLIHQEKVGDRIGFQLKAERPLPKVKVIITHFIEIVNNILSNAIDAIEKSGKIEILVDAKIRPGWVGVAIRDTGKGMEPEMVKRIFEPFFTTKNLDTRNSVSIDGHGLGLWNVYNLVRKAGGDVQVHSQLGAGTTVTITLPIGE